MSMRRRWYVPVRRGCGQVRFGSKTTRRPGASARVNVVTMAVAIAMVLSPGARIAWAGETSPGSKASPTKSSPGAASRTLPAAASPASPSSSPSSSPAVRPEPPLHEQIDRLIEARLAQDLPGQTPAAPAADAEFLRRVRLDLTGMIPTADEARAFLDDPSPYKRSRLIDALLESPAYARRMQQVFDVMLMERRPDTHIPSPGWREFLHQAFAENRPYDVLVRQILESDGTEPKTRPAARFMLDREADPNVLVRDVGRLFLGVDLQCCQCHDHLMINDYKQQHYYGLYAFVSRTVLVNDPKAGAVLGEKAEGDVTFTSVFKKKVTHRTGPRVLDNPPVAEPAVPKGQEYLVPPDKDGKLRPVPAVSRRALLGTSLASKDTPAFARNIVNRLWALMMGRGIVHPVDLHHDENPPSNPELLDLLTSRFVALNYDVKAFLRELTLTRAYQRSSEPPPNSSPELAEPRHFAVAAVRPVSPEQLAWSVMQGVGLAAATAADVAYHLDGADPRMKAILDLDARRKALRPALIEEAVYTRLAPNVGTFVGQFGGVAGQPQDAAEAASTVDQALFIINGEPIKSWLNPAPGWLVGRLNALADPSAVADELYLSLLSRRPTQEERAEIADYLARRAANPPADKDKGKNPAQERIAALRELAWSVLASAEFRFNH